MKKLKFTWWICIIAAFSWYILAAMKNGVEQDIFLVISNLFVCTSFLVASLEEVLKAIESKK